MSYEQTVPTCVDKQFPEKQMVNRQSSVCLYRGCTKGVWFFTCTAVKDFVIISANIAGEKS